MRDEPDAQDERALIQRLAQGDEAALAVICERYRARLWRYLWRQMDGNGVEEALQDTLLAIWHSARRFRGAAPVAVWIFRIAHHVAAQARRARNRRAERHAVALLDDEGEDPTGASFEGAVIERLALDDALARLSPKHRAVIDLVCYHGFAIDEVAHILDIPSGTVRSRLSYARQTLSKAISVDEVMTHGNE